jgi:hypothetical protein
VRDLNSRPTVYKTAALPRCDWHKCRGLLVALMRRAIIISGLLLCLLFHAYATSHYETNYRDTIRPHGHKRSDTVCNSALDLCYSRTGLSSR